MKSLAMLVCAVTMTMSVGAATAFAASPVAPSAQVANVDPSVAAEEAKPVSTTAGAAGATDAERYGAREQNAKGLEEFKGGSASIYIGGSAVTVLLVVLLVVIIL